ncbi:HIRA-interacting protein 5 [Pseudovirgaria hyperparasitica]|uniref:HIRA-interacting protein 5 n=1 Tax=Pseudovirgaria hyperparasitica TaxID=470096 RepID=A0A6A6VQD5_9PEZI|nr:HIRA-interacting protein 5 [Pseudovirgaria hyperparasitica]KAF2752858.1 HIRA-interacting protein 5 [Pseudovirgaria hyperparasitica]
MASRSVPRHALQCLYKRPLTSAAEAPKRILSTQASARCLHASARTSPLGPSQYRPSIPQRPIAKNSLQSRRTIFIQTETTPNEDALKFNPNTRVLPETISSGFLEYLNPRSTLAPPHPSPLAAKLMAVDGVTSVFFGVDYITVTKDSATPWAHVKPEVFSIINEFVLSGQPMVKSVEDKAGEQGQESSEQDSLAYNENDSETVSMIKELLDTRIRPAIQEDGGDLEFRGFVNGQVLLKLVGACRTCDSSTVTLRNGIEGMLMHYIDQVQGVQQVMDQEEEIAMREFAKFEEKLKETKGAAAIAASPLDAAP